jgi:thiamine biosynthesis lipoprotein
MKKLLCVTTAALVLTGCSAQGPKSYTRTVPVMNTFVQVKVISDTGRSRGELKRIVDGSLALARDLEKKFSIYDPKSEINRLNIGKKLRVSDELFDLLSKANRISELTGGEFDITIAPVMKANGFYGDMPRELLGRIPAGTGGVGWQNVALSYKGRTVSLKNKAWVDLSGIAKGYIVDRMAAFLREKGVKSFLVNAGGDIYCSEKEKDGSWNVGLREPGTSRILISIPIKDNAIATSGDYENVALDKDTGEKMSHIVDPAGRRMIREKASSVTVIAPTCTKADALATAFMAMGRERALELADGMKNITVIVADEKGITEMNGRKEK